jgi:bifunctional DNA-binding transcriptional regulator/antitoxin component of YhaV-PrlF toxin-antitoxin module
MDAAYVSSKGQLVIPARIRRKVHGAKNNEVRDATKKERHVCARARVGERPVSSENKAGGLFQHPAREYIRSMRGMLKSSTSVTEDLLEERKKDRVREEGRTVKTRAR